MNEGLDRLAQLVLAEHKMTVKKLAELVKKADIREEDLEPFADYNHPPNHGYGRKMAILDDRFEIMVMTWNPGDFSAVHDHGYTEWGAVQVFGDVMHHTFSNQGSEFRLSQKEILTKGTIVKVNHPLIHQMGNVTSAPYLTLHIYGSDQHKGVITADSKIYDLEQRVVKHTTGGAFFNLPDDEVYDISPMKPIAHHTFVHQAAVLIQYYDRYTSDHIIEKQQKLLAQLRELREVQPIIND